MEETIGERIRRKMKERGWKRPKLRTELKERAQLVISVEALRQYMIDKHKPGRAVRKALAIVFDTTEEDIEFGESSTALRPPGASYRDKSQPHPEEKLMRAFSRLLPEQQARFLADVEALAETNMALGRRVLRELKYNLNAENLPVAPHDQPTAPKTRKQSK